MSILAMVNTFLCLAISLRILLFTRTTEHYNRYISYTAWFICAASFYVALRTIYGYYLTVDIAEVILNTCFCAALYANKGNISRIFKTKKEDEHENNK